MDGVAPNGGEGEALADANNGVSDGRLVRVIRGVPLPVAMPDMLARCEAVVEADPLPTEDTLALWEGEGLRWGKSDAWALAVEEEDGKRTEARPLGVGRRVCALLPLSEADPESEAVKGAVRLALLLAVLEADERGVAEAAGVAEPECEGRADAEGVGLALLGCVAGAKREPLAQPVLLGVRAAVIEAGTVAVAPCPGLSVGCGAVALLDCRALSLGDADAVPLGDGNGEAETPGSAEAEALAAALLQPEGPDDPLALPLPLAKSVAAGELVGLVQALGGAERVFASAPGDGVGGAVGGAEGVEKALPEGRMLRVPAPVALGENNPLPVAVRDGAPVAPGVAMPLAVAAAPVPDGAPVLASLGKGEAEAAADEGYGEGEGDRVAASETGMVFEGAPLDTGRDPALLLDVVGVRAPLPEAAVLAEPEALTVTASNPVGLAVGLADGALCVAAVVALGAAEREAEAEASPEAVGVALRVSTSAALAVAAAALPVAPKELLLLKLAPSEAVALSVALAEDSAVLVGAVEDACGVAMADPLAAALAPPLLVAAGLPVAALLPEAELEAEAALLGAGLALAGLEAEELAPGGVRVPVCRGEGLPLPLCASAEAVDSPDVDAVSQGELLLDAEAVEQLLSPLDAVLAGLALVDAVLQGVADVPTVAVLPKDAVTCAVIVAGVPLLEKLGRGEGPKETLSRALPLTAEKVALSLAVRLLFALSAARPEAEANALALPAKRDAEAVAQKLCAGVGESNGVGVAVLVAFAVTVTAATEGDIAAEGVEKPLGVVRVLSEALPLSVLAKLAEALWEVLAEEVPVRIGVVHAVGEPLSAGEPVLVPAVEAVGLSVCNAEAAAVALSAVLLDGVGVPRCRAVGEGSPESVAEELGGEDVVASRLPEGDGQADGLGEPLGLPPLGDGAPDRLCKAEADRELATVPLGTADAVAADAEASGHAEAVGVTLGGADAVEHPDAA